jgi:hypothetical protein
MLTTIFVYWLLVALSPPASLKTFTSSDGGFRFQYSDILVDCTASQNSATSSCMSQGNVCIGPGSEGATLACFAYPNERFQEKPAFVTATFYVSRIPAATMEERCLEKSPNWYVISSKASTTTINHIVFKTFEIGDNWTSGGQYGPVYRTFHARRCYELGIQNVISRAEYDPGTVKQFTKRDSDQVENCLRQALNSFVFLK